MAVYAAHITRTLQGNPSVFQVAAQEALGATVKPALRKLIEYLAAVYPNKCGWCERWYDELYLLFDWCLQYHYLKHYAGSFSETFYGLLRSPLSSSEFAPADQRLSAALERGSLLLLVVVPYLRDKLQCIVDGWREENEDGRLGKSGWDRLRRAAIHVHTTSYVVYHTARLVQLARYMHGSVRAPSPALAVLGLRLKHAPPRDVQDSWGDWGRTLINGDFGSAMVTFPMIGQLVLRGAEYAAFVVQFLRWWQSRAATDCSAALAVPPPPARDERAIRYRNRCPLCLQTWKIPTVLPVSGYIFCYACISRHVRARGACPVSRAPAGEGALVRLYVD